jgi:hypothetical protein
MDLLKYLEPMKNLPERFSNLAFWRGVRKLRDEVVNAFEYVDSWGESIEASLDSQYNGYASYGMSNPITDFTALIKIDSISQYSDGVKIQSSYTDISVTVPSDCELDRVSNFIPVLFIDGGSPSVIADLSTLLDVKVTNKDPSGSFTLTLSPSGAAPNIQYYVPLPKNFFINPTGNIKLSVLILYKV